MDTNLTTNLISEVTSMDKDLTTALISAGVSVIMTGIYWCGKGVKKLWVKHITFITYKNYVKEFFELYIHALKTNTITYDNTTYNIDDLEFTFVIEDGNQSEKISTVKIPTLILAFICERDLLSDDETTLFVNILANLLPEKWILGCKKIDKNKKIILFSQLGIFLSKTPTQLASLDKDHYIYSRSSQDTIEKLQTQFKHNESNKIHKRIKKIIKKNLNLLS